MSSQRVPLKLRALLALFLCLTFAPAWPVDAALPQQGESGAPTLRIGAFEPSTLDPALATDTSSMLIVDQLFAGLTRIDDATGEAVLDLADSWQMSDDATVFTFTLRSDPVWSDGSLLTPQDVVSGVLRSLDPATQAGFAYTLFVIENAEGYNNGSIIDPSQVGVSATPDGKGVCFRLNTPFSLFPSVAALAVARPVPHHAIQAHPGNWTDPGYIVTSGAYTLETWTRGREMQLQKNKDYWDAGNTGIATVYVAIADQATAWQMYLRGDLDTATVAPGELAHAEGDPVLGPQLHRAPVASTYYYGFSLSQPPFGDERVRRAFAAAVDRQGLIDSLLGGTQLPALTFTPPGVYGHVEHPEEVGIPYSPTMASELLATAGYTDGVGLPEVTLWVNPGHEAIGEYVAGNWRSNLGVTVTVDSSLGWGTPYFSKLDSGTAQVWRMGWSGDYNDAYNFLGDAVAGSWSRYGDWKHAAYDDLLSEIRVTEDPAARKPLYEQAERTLVYTDAVMIPLYHYSNVVATKPYLDRTYALSGLGHFAEWSFDLSEAATVSPDEATVMTTAVDTVAYTLPEGTFTDTVTLTHTVEMAGAAPPPGGYLVGTDHVFEVTAVDAESDAPLEPTGHYTMTVGYSDQEVSAAGIEDEGMLGLFYWDGSAWMEETTSQVDTEANTVTATPDHFSLWAVMREPYPAFLPVDSRS